MNILTDRSLPTPRVATGSFSEADWAEVLDHLAQILGPEARRYSAVPAAKIAAAIPYLAGSEDPDRFAVSNLLTFHGATKARALFNHRPSDDTDVLRRLACFHVGQLSDQRVVRYGLTVLSLISLGDHQHDVEEDRRIGKYNPVAEGRWDIEALMTSLEADLGKNQSLRKAFEAVVGGELSPMGFWVN